MKEGCRNKKEVIKAVKIDYTEFENASIGLRNNKNFIKELLTVHGCYVGLLAHAGEKVKNDLEFAKEIVKIYPTAIECFSEKIRNENPDLVLNANTRGGYNNALTKNQENSKEFWLQVVDDSYEKFGTFSTSQIPKDFWLDEDFVRKLSDVIPVTHYYGMDFFMETAAENKASREGGDKTKAIEDVKNSDLYKEISEKEISHRKYGDAEYIKRVTDLIKETDDAKSVRKIYNTLGDKDKAKIQQIYNEKIEELNGQKKQNSAPQQSTTVELDDKVKQEIMEGLKKIDMRNEKQSTTLFEEICKKYPKQDIVKINKYMDNVQAKMEREQLESEFPNIIAEANKISSGLAAEMTATFAKQIYLSREQKEALESGKKQQSNFDVELDANQMRMILRALNCYDKGKDKEAEEIFVKFRDCYKNKVENWRARDMFAWYDNSKQKMQGNGQSTQQSQQSATKSNSQTIIGDVQYKYSTPEDQNYNIIMDESTFNQTPKVSEQEQQIQKHEKLVTEEKGSNKTNERGQYTKMDLQDLMGKFAEVHNDFYSKKTHTKEEISQKRKLNYAMKKLIDQEIENCSKDGESQQKDEELIKQMSNPVVSADINALANNPLAVAKLFKIQASGVYEKEGQPPVRLTQQQRTAISSVLVQVSEKRLQGEEASEKTNNSKNNAANKDNQTTAEKDSELGGED